MALIKQVFRQYWLNILAFAMCLAAIVRYARLAEWEQNFVPVASAVFGFACVVASDEVVEWTGRYGWTRQQWRQYPGTSVRVAGILGLVVGTIILYCR